MSLHTLKVSFMAATSASIILGGAALPALADPVKNIVLVHGAWVDGLPNGHPGQSVLHSKWRQPWPFAIEISLDDIENLVVDLEVAVNDLMMAIFNVKGIIAGT